MEGLHLAGDIGASIAILVCLYFIWDLRKEREIYEAGADRRLDDLRSFLKREIRLTY